jgi:hypothetical protein
MSSAPETRRENRASAPTRHGLSARAIGAVLLAGIVVMAAEATVRIEDAIRWHTPLLSRLANPEDLKILDAVGAHPRPGASFRKWQINSLGARGPNPDPALAHDRVVFMGASETIGQYESPDHEYVRQLSDTLRQRGCRADLLNAGFWGMSLPTVEQDFRLRIAAWRPRVAVYYPTPAQYLAEDTPHAVRPDSSGRVQAAGPWWHLRIVDRARDALKVMLPGMVQSALRSRDLSTQRAHYPADWVFRSVPPSRLEGFDHDLRVLVGSVHARRVQLVLATHANAFTGSPPGGSDRLNSWEYSYPRSTGPTIVTFDSLAAIRIRRIAADSSVPLVDVWQGFHQIGSDSMFADFSHFTDAGSAHMAELLAPAVERALGCQVEEKAQRP